MAITPLQKANHYTHKEDNETFEVIFSLEQLKQALADEVSAKFAPSRVKAKRTIEVLVPANTRDGRYAVVRVKDNYL